MIEENKQESREVLEFMFAIDCFSLPIVKSQRQRRRMNELMRRMQWPSQAGRFRGLTAHRIWPPLRIWLRLITDVGLNWKGFAR